MKSSFARKPSHQRNHTPSVIHLPPPKPPVTAKRQPTIAEPSAEPEPQVTERVEVQATAAPRLNRQQRRNALRAEAKALRRAGQPPKLNDTSPPRVAPAIGPEPTADQPLPRARSLTTAKPRGLALVTQRLRAFFYPRRTIARAPTTAQLRTLQKDLAALQRSIDRMLDGATA